MIDSNSTFITVWLTGILLVSAVTDIRWRKIPNWLTYSTAIFGILLQSYLGGLGGFLFSIKGLFMGIGLLIIPYMLGSMGAGDVKLLGSIGCVLGVLGVLQAFIYIAFVSSIYAIIAILKSSTIMRGSFDRAVTDLKCLILTMRVGLDPNLKSGERAGMCFGVAISIGTISYLLLDLFGRQPIKIG
jgi:prepilin peptidase CpaA